MGKLIVIIFIAYSSFGQAAVLIEEGGKPVNQSYEKVSSDSEEFRSARKIGVGLSAAGALGVIGTNIEINFTPQTSLKVGFGMGEGFQAFAFQVKGILSGTYFVPFVGMGFARWYTVGKNASINESNPSILAKRFLNDSEKRSGEFAENLLYPSAGIQYQQLKGDWAGASIYAEILMFIDIDDFVSAPTGEVGFLYYF